MFRQMRRSKQQLGTAECEQLLRNNTSGVLAVAGDDDYPYAVPLSYVYDKGKIYFHCAKEGHKIDAIKRNYKVSFCVTDTDKVVPKEYTTYFKSVIIFGKAEIIEDDRKADITMMLAKKYGCDDAGSKKEIDSSINRMNIVEIDIDHMTGKAAIELVK